MGWFGLGETEFQNFQNGWNREPQMSRMGTDGGEVFVGDGGRIFDEGTDKICENDKGTDNMGEIGPQISRMGTDGGEVFVGDGGEDF
jgi:hypothetical protein